MLRIAVPNKGSLAETAAEMLADTGETITAIACRTGFASHAHLTTSFRRAFGVTPSALRRG